MRTIYLRLWLTCRRSRPRRTRFVPFGRDILVFVEMPSRLRLNYLAFTAAQIDYFPGLDHQAVGYEPPQIMLIHDNQLNADVIAG